MEFTTTDIPRDESPPSEMPTGETSYDPEFPGSTPEAPFGYKADGTPYKRRPNRSGAGATSPKGGRGRAGDSQARAAAAMLAQMNTLVGLSLNVFGMPQTAMAIADANEQFESMALEALRTDAALCKKILSAGGMSGKTMLVMAYGNLGMSLLPAARAEFAEKREEKFNDDELSGTES